MNLIGITGKANAGKSTAASVLVKEFGFVEVALADPMKRICKEVFQFTDEQLWGSSENRDRPDVRYLQGVMAGYSGGPFGVEPHKVYLTPRKALQTLGTEWGRRCYEDTWVDIAIRTAKALFETRNAYYERSEGLRFTPGPYLPPNALRKGVVISDIRFPNEVAAIKKASGVIWLIERPSSGLVGDAGAHISEAGIDIGCVDHTLSNGGSLEEFRSMVAGVMGFMLKDRKTITAYVPPEEENG